MNAATRLRLDTTCPTPATVRVAVAGEVDLATADALRNELLTVLREQAPTVVDVDLAEVTFLDCAGIGALVAARNAAAGTGRQLRLTRANPTVRRMLAVAGCSPP